jgi:hypothetical protein
VLRDRALWAYIYKFAGRCTPFGGLGGFLQCLLYLDNLIRMKNYGMEGIAWLRILEMIILVRSGMAFYHTSVWDTVEIVS